MVLRDKNLSLSYSVNTIHVLYASASSLITLRACSIMTHNVNNVVFLVSL